ncbi:MAG: hypothetical protein AMXMBFR57_16620 [Acidimicrobiia bacterium]
MTDSLFVTLSTFAEHDDGPLRLLQASGVDFTINDSGKRITTEELVARAQSCTVVVAGVERYDAAVLSQLPSLRCISRCGVGVDAIDLEAARARGIAVVNTPTVPAQAVAELTLAMMLAVSRNLCAQANLMAGRQWRRLESHLIAGRTVGLIGLGRIGRRVVELLSPFGATLVASDPSADPEWARQHGVELLPLGELLRRSHIVSIHAAGASASPLKLGAAELGVMPRGAVLINVARGGMVDEAALLEALVSGHLSGAGLDVFANEPYDGPLCGLSNVVLTPHSATLPVETRVAMELECVRKALAFIGGTLLASERVI